MSNNQSNPISNKDAISPLISIIIPVYNVESYLAKCIDSVISQTYTNIEILLIDDGSTDISGDICDKYAQHDGRIKVVHQKNGGLSKARNTGINNASGEYITFIDSDDYISPKMLEILLNSAENNECDISTCQYTKVSEYTNLNGLNIGENQIIVLSSEQSLELMLYQNKLTNSAWAKLYKTTLFKDIRFPKGKLYEDLGTTYKVFSKSKRVVINGYCGYYYLQRKSSITNSAFTLERMNGLEFAQEQLRFIELHYPKIKNAAIDRLFTEARYVISAININSDASESALRECCRIIKKYRIIILLNYKSGIVNRLLAAISTISINIMTKIIWLKARRLKNEYL